MFFFRSLHSSKIIILYLLTSMCLFFAIFFYVFFSFSALWQFYSLFPIDSFFFRQLPIKLSKSRESEDRSKIIFHFSFIFFGEGEREEKTERNCFLITVITQTKIKGSNIFGRRGGRGRRRRNWRRARRDWWR